VDGTRLSLGLALGGPSRSRLGRPDSALQWIDRAESLGLHSAWVPEMHFAPGVTASPLLLLAAYAARSRRLRLGTTSLLLPIHDPDRLASEIAALDRRTGGRLSLGLGRGFRRPLFEAFGVDAAAKRDRFDAALDRILERWRRDYAPRQVPHPPLAVAAFGPKGLAQAARRGLPYLASPVEPIDQIEENQARHAEGLPDSTDAASLPVPIMRSAFVAADDREAARVRASLESEARGVRGRVPASLARAAESDLHDRVLVGTASEVRDRLARWCERVAIDLLIVRIPEAGLESGARVGGLERLAELVEGFSPPARRGAS
jgi:alkanesulfonate monooxygenase SsuD/methylene tetrahydromethanopterin reductase-like flavin-dependent oxidoreductase (luciferase family)